MNNAYIPFNHLISEHQDSKQDDKTVSLYYSTDLDCSPHHTSERSLHRPSRLQQMARDLDKLLTT
jgi:hypothetical protein